MQVKGLGFSLVELLSICPTNWGMTPVDSMNWLTDRMISYYPIGDFKVIDALHKETCASKAEG